MTEATALSRSVAGRVAIVTGAASGMGRATALLLAREGAKVAVTDLDPAACKAVAAEAGDRARAFALDVSDGEAIKRVVADIAAHFGGIDILINNVGGAIRMRPFAEFTAEQIDAEIRRSLMPTLYCCHAVLPHLAARGGGTIVNVSSNATRGIHRVPYSAAKGGVNGITQSLAMELAGQNIRVVATAPGGTEAPPRRVPRNQSGDSEAEKVWMSQVVDQVRQSAFMKRYGTIDEQAAPILFLASDEASYITGTVLPVAGGDTG